MAARKRPTDRASLFSKSGSCTDGQSKPPGMKQLRRLFKYVDEDANLISLDSDADSEEDADSKHDVRATFHIRMNSGCDGVEITKS